MIRVIIRWYIRSFFNIAGLEIRIQTQKKQSQEGILSVFWVIYAMKYAILAIFWHVILSLEIVTSLEGILSFFFLETWQAF